MHRSSAALCAALLLVLLTSCLTTHSNHGSSVGQGKTSVGVEASLLRVTTLPDVDYLTYRVNAAYGVTDTFDLAAAVGLSTIEGSSYKSVGVRTLWALPLETGSLTFDLSLDYYFGFSYGDKELDDNDSFGAGSSSMVQPTVSAAYSFLKGDFKPFVGVHLTPLVVSGYAGLDMKIGPLRPSVLGGLMAPTLNSGGEDTAIRYFLEPGLAFEF